MKRPIPIKSRIAAKTIADNLVTWRKLQAITSQELADRAGVSRDTISKLEHGDPTVSFATVINVCNVLGITDSLVKSTDPYETDYGRLRADQSLPKRVRR